MIARQGRAQSTRTKSVNKFVCACVSRGSPLQGAAHRGSAGRAAQERALAAQAGDWPFGPGARAGGPGGFEPLALGPSGSGRQPRWTGGRASSSGLWQAAHSRFALFLPY